MGGGYFNPWQDAKERECRTCRHAIGMRGGHHLWCARHRRVVAYACASWEREAGTGQRIDGLAREFRHATRNSDEDALHSPP
jgi:hypothetical protein